MQAFAEHPDFVSLFATKIKDGKKKIKSAEACHKEMEQGSLPAVDLRSLDVSSMDFSKYEADWLRFDGNTIFPQQEFLPKDFDSSQIMESGKSPGLGLDDLPYKGQGMKMAIIDGALPPHLEYSENIAHYEQIGFPDGPLDGSMHGAAVASIAVGKNIGVAPKAQLYYFAVADGDINPNAENDCTFQTIALQKILDINKSIAAEKDKILAVSISTSFFENDKGYVQWQETLNEAKKQGVFVNTVNIGRDYNLYDGGLNRDLKNNNYSGLTGKVDSREKPALYPEGSAIQKRLFPEHTSTQNEATSSRLLFPMDHRTVAGPQSPNDYSHDARGGWSWIKPYETALYVLAKEADMSLTPEKFWELGLRSGSQDSKADGLKLNPEKLFTLIKNNERINANRLKIASLQSKDAPEHAPLINTPSQQISASPRNNSSDLLKSIYQKKRQLFDEKY